MRPIWVASFMDEEGARFGAALFGSRAFAGQDVSASLELRDAGGTTLAAAMRERGFDPGRLPAAARAGQLGAYVELHIEQGPVLENAGRRVGVVEAITGMAGYRVRLEGEANHAGTTPMGSRRDAVLGAARIALELREAARADERLRATVGQVRSSPPATNVVPGACELTIDLRTHVAEEHERRQAWVRELVERIAREERLEATVEQTYAIPPVAMDARVIAAIEAAAAEEGEPALRMFSGAGHDAMNVAPHAPAGMLFVPSRGGLSHTPREWTDAADCELGARVLARTLRTLSA